MAEHHPLRTPDLDPQSASHAQLNAEAERRARECRSADMPDLSHLRRRDYDVVYEPSDDTYLLIDAIGFDLDAAAAAAVADGGADEGPKEGPEGGRGGEGDGTTTSDGEGSPDDGVGGVGRRPSPAVETTLEIGCGTGVPTAYLAARLRAGRDPTEGDAEGKIAHHATDVNPDALRIATSVVRRAGIPPDEFAPARCDLASDLLPRLEEKVDVLIFNPPYVPTPDDEVGSDGIEASWAGGKDGRVVLDRALPQIARLLKRPEGVGYVVVVDDNRPEEVCRILEEEHGVRAVPWLRRRARNEFLTVLKLTPILWPKG
ncbi:hypothetical protein ACHAWF_016523 [Thalassiosira exigua]